MTPIHNSHSLRWLAALVLLTIAVFWPALAGDFIFDDYPNIVTNSRIHAEQLDLASIQRAAGAYDAGSYGRPLATISFAIDHSIGGKDPWGYKLSGLIVHLLNALLVFLLLRRLLALDPRTAMAGGLASFTIALAWAAHPLQVSAVMYIVQRMETLSLTFVLLALMTYLRGRSAQIAGRRGWPWLLACLPLVALGLLSKETAALFPAYCLALELTVLGFAAQSPAASRRWRWAYGLGCVAAAVVFFVALVPMFATPEAYEGRDFTLAERLLTQLRVLPLYLQWILLPLPSTLVFYYDALRVSHGLLDPITTLLGGLFLAALLGLALSLRRRAPLAALGVLWFFAAHLITSSVIPLELAFEHRNYFGLLGVLLVVGDLVSRTPVSDDPRFKRVVIGMLMVFLLFLTLLRSATWGDPFLLATDLVQRNPQSPRASSDLATLYAGMSDSNSDSPFYSFAMAEFERGSRLANASPLPEQGLILMAATAGKPVKDEWWESLVHKVQTRPIGPQEIMAVTGLLKQRYKGVELDDVRLTQAYGTLLSRREMPPQLHAQFGDYALVFLQDEALAERMFVEMVDRSADDPEYVLRVARGLASEGHLRQARAMLVRARKLGMLEGYVQGIDDTLVEPVQSPAQAISG